jgi:hypothetical protein
VHPAQRPEGAVEVVGAGQGPRLDDVEQVGLGRFGLPLQVAGRGGARDRLGGQVTGAGGVPAPEQRLGQLGVGLGRQQPHPPQVLGDAHGGGDVLAAHRVRDGELLEVEGGEREREPPVGLLQRARRPAGAGALGEQARVDGQQHGAVEVVGADLDVREVGHQQRGVGRRCALVEQLASRRDVGRGGVGVALDHRTASGQRVPPGHPAGLGRGRERAGGLPEQRQEGGGVVAVAGSEQPPQRILEVAGCGTGRAANHASLPSGVGRPGPGAAR